MNAEKVIEEIKREYPGKNIIVNDPDDPTEIICEVEPASKNPAKSVTVAVLDRTIKHMHGKTEQTYEVLRGILEINIEGKTHILQRGQKITIKPNQPHNAKGKETWVKVTSRPGWKPEDHILVTDEKEVLRKDTDNKLRNN